ncbi:MAG TPA: MFS transporter, partial [Actinobacteria bacterium]|nr:MFS transporter [Actinomycetota bacterium]
MTASPPVEGTSAMPTEPGVDAASDEAPLPGRWIALAVLALAQFVLVLDSTVVNVALPSIQREFDLPEARLAWIVNGYGLAFGGLLLLGGSLGDLYGRRKLFMLGIGVFSGASLIAGFAWNADIIIAMRFLQGAGAAMAAPAALSSITRIFTIPKERTKALGTWGGISALGGTIGAVLSGFITEYQSWRWVFFVTVPVTLIALALAPKFVPESRAPSRPKLDVLGAILITSAIG